MKRFLRISIAALLLACSLSGLTAQTAHSLLWKISGKDIDSPSYLFGTIHMLPNDKYFFTDRMKEALTSCEVLGLEADIDIRMAEQLKMAKEMMMPEGKTWKDYMSDEDYAALRAALVDSLGLKPGRFDKRYVRIRPVYVSGLILADLVGKVKLYEMELSGMAKKQKKPIMGLETIQQQLDLVSSISIEEQMNDVKEEGGNVLKDYNQLLDAYLGSAEKSKQLY